MFFYRQVLATDARRICFSEFLRPLRFGARRKAILQRRGFKYSEFCRKLQDGKRRREINPVAADNLYACDCKSGVIIFICILADKRGESVNSIVYDIQTNETQGEFPYKLFYCENVITADHCHTETEIISILSGEATVQINGVK